MFRAQFKMIRYNRGLQINSLLALFSTTLTIIIGVIFSPLLTRLMPRNDYGMLSYVASIQGLLVAFSAPGIGSAISYSIARGYDSHFKDGTIRRAIVIFRNGLFLLPAVIWFYFSDFGFSSILLIVLIITPFSYGLDTSEYFLVGKSDFRSIMWRRILGLFVISFSSVLCAYIYPTAMFVFSGRSLVGSVVNLIIFFALIKKVENNYRDPNFDKMSNNYSFVSTVNTVASQIDRVILGYIGGFNLFAGYSLAMSLSSPIDGITKSVNKIAFAKMAVHREKEQRQFWVISSFAYVIVISFLALITWYYVFPTVYIYFPKYPELLYLMPILLVCPVVETGTSLGLVYTQFNAIEVWKKYEVFINTSRIISMPLCIVFFGVWGALWNQCIYSIISFCFFNFHLWNGLISKEN